MPHKLSAGGEIVLHMDNHIHVTVGGAYSAGEQVMLNRGPYSDAETMFRFHTVDEEVGTCCYRNLCWSHFVTQYISNARRSVYRSTDSQPAEQQGVPRFLCAYSFARCYFHL